MQNQEDEKLITRWLTVDDLPALEKLLADPDLVQAAGLEITDDSFMRRWAFEGWLAQGSLFGLFVDNQLVGLIDWFQLQEGVGEVGYLLTEPYRGRGMMTTALARFLAEAPLPTMMAEAARKNVASQRVLAKNDFHLVKKQGGRYRYRWTASGADQSQV